MASAAHANRLVHDLKQARPHVTGVPEQHAPLFGDNAEAMNEMFYFKSLDGRSQKPLVLKKDCAVRK